MIIGVLLIKLRIPENHSLKGKRQVIKSITSRIKNKFNVSVAEVEDQELWQLASLGISCVSNNSRHANQILSKVMDFVNNNRKDCEIIDYEIEITPSL